MAVTPDDTGDTAARSARRQVEEAPVAALRNVKRGRPEDKAGVAVCHSSGVLPRSELAARHEPTGERLAATGGAAGSRVLEQPTAEVVKEVISARLGVAPTRLSPWARLDDLAADSLARVELVLAFEEVFDVTIADEATEQLRTVQDAVDCVCARLAA